MEYLPLGAISGTVEVIISLKNAYLSLFINKARLP
jgi:hypothetical protein